MSSNSKLIKTLLFIKLTSYYLFLSQITRKIIYFLKKNARPIATIPIAATRIQELNEPDFTSSTFSCILASAFTCVFLNNLQKQISFKNIQGKESAHS